MFFIFGWNHQKTTPYGAIQEHTCENCHNTEFWHINELSRYFTLFFIPIFPHGSTYWYFCPICNHGITLSSEDFELYKSIAAINSSYKKKEITEEEAIKEIDSIHKIINDKSIENRKKHIEESKNWVELASQKTNEELLLIINANRGDYNPAFIIAAEAELEKRNITH
jgi:hypothetical protein